MSSKPVNRRDVDNAYGHLLAAIRERESAALVEFDRKLELDEALYLATLNKEIQGGNEGERRAFAFRLLRAQYDAHHAAQRALVTADSKLEAARYRVEYLRVAMAMDDREPPVY